MKAMIRYLSLGIIWAATAVGGFNAPATAADKAPSVSSALAKPLGAAQRAIQEKKFDEALQALTDAEANPKKTAYDTFVMHQLKAYALSQTGRTDEAMPSYVAQVESGFLPPEESDRMTRALAGVAFQNKDYAKAIEYGQRTIRGGKANDDTWYIVAAAQYVLERPADAASTLKEYYADVAKRGAKPTDATLNLELQIAAKAKDAGGMAAALEKMVEHYPKPERWHDLLVTLRDLHGRGADSEEYTLNIYRLMRETGTLKDGTEIIEMASLAVKRGSPGEATDALRRGNEGGLLTTDGNRSAAKELQQSAGAAEKSDRATLTKFEAEAKGAKGGEADVRLGQAFLSYDQADKAVEALQRGIGKGSLRNADEAQILLGIAYLKQGKKEEAASAFAAAKGTDPKYGQLARLWAIHARASAPATAG